MGPEGDRAGARLGRGCRCFAAWIDSVVAGYGWLSTGPEWIGELQLEITPKHGEGYIWNCVTMPGHRRQGIFRSLLQGISEMARQEGIGRLWIGSVAIPAERALGPAGFTPALCFRSVVFAGCRWLWTVPAADESLAVAACEVLAVNRGMSVRRARSRRH
jgi:GNAT superfamily N-acetyltransferase